MANDFLLFNPNTRLPLIQSICWITSPPWVISSRGWSDSTTYDEAESTRNTLRSVCKTWDDCLCLYAHRFVRMRDVVHGIVPARYLKSALRISFDGHDGIYCDLCKPQKFRLDEGAAFHQRSDKKYLELCSHILDKMKPLRAEIIDLPTRCSGIENLVSPTMFPRAVHIRAMWGNIPITEVVQLIESLPSLHHMYVPCIWVENKVSSLKSTTLTTLFLSFQTLSFTSFAKESIHLPALRHLHLDYACHRDSDDYNEPAWLPLLRVIGKELRTLYLPWDTMFYGQIPGDLWNLCPKLEDLFHSQQLLDVPAPPEGHPLHTLGTSFYWLPSQDDIKEHIPSWPGLRTIRVDVSWEAWIRADFAQLARPQLDWLSSRFSLEDRTGQSYVEYFREKDRTPQSSSEAPHLE
ncbi:hypothetical protein CPB86DRAFT_869041 [Serendipita vermifera]|nr:hypothetical protein CPB86DRAFT_869041 [Serendipita vermifera]